ncbi:MAG: hypothetical protein KDI63_03490 [Gammaproteobacteria bacterium]|nr:hypothetical protein [Gammaproteobacteria bacterium]
MNLRILLLVIFSLINGVVLYLFLLQLPFGQEAFLLSLAYWDKFAIPSAAAVTVAAATTLIGLAAAWRLHDDWKHRLIYLRWRHPHPASNAFLAVRRQPFDQQALLSRFPQVKDSGFDPQVQTSAWLSVYPQYSQQQVIVDTMKHWSLIRDLYVIAILFLVVFFVAWLSMYPVPFGIVSSHIFIFGAQVIFLFLMARRVGFRLVDNLLGVCLGVDTEPEPVRSSGKRTHKNNKK